MKNIYTYLLDKKHTSNQGLTMNYPYMYKFARSAYTVSSPNIILRKQMSEIKSQMADNINKSEGDKDTPQSTARNIDTPIVRDNRDYRPTEEELENDKSVKTRATDIVVNAVRQGVDNMLRNSQ
jgi:hypothetical protein